MPDCTRKLMGSCPPIKVPCWFIMSPVGRLHIKKFFPVPSNLWGHAVLNAFLVIDHSLCRLQVEKKDRNKKSKKKKERKQKRRSDSGSSEEEDELVRKYLAIVHQKSKRKHDEPQVTPKTHCDSDDTSRKHKSKKTTSYSMDKLSCVQNDNKSSGSRRRPERLKRHEERGRVPDYSSDQSEGDRLEMDRSEGERSEMDRKSKGHMRRDEDEHRHHTRLSSPCPGHRPHLSGYGLLVSLIPIPHSTYWSLVDIPWYTASIASLHDPKSMQLFLAANMTVVLWFHKI